MNSRSPEPAATSAQEGGVLDVAAATLASVGSQVSMTADAAVDLGRAVVKLADQRARERPWHVAVLAASVGVLVGLLVRRRS